jgi:hypothetical protein
MTSNFLSGFYTLALGVYDVGEHASKRLVTKD